MESTRNDKENSIADILSCLDKINSLFQEMLNQETKSADKVFEFYMHLTFLAHLKNFNDFLGISNDELDKTKSICDKTLEYLSRETKIKEIFDGLNNEKRK